jgi:hypothetical protein
VKPRCSVILRDRGRCHHDAVIVWKDRQGVARGWCVEHIRQGHVEAIRHGWIVSESALEVVA